MLTDGSADSYEYDALSRLVQYRPRQGNTTRYVYDAADNLSKVIDALGHETAYTYDASGNLTSETDALGNTVKYSYTPEGWLATVTDAEGQVTRYTYDRTGNILTTDYAGEQTETNTYNELGLLTTVTSAEGVTEYQYDQASRLISVKQPNGETVSYTYDGRGNRSSMTYPNGKTVTYTYDSMDRMTSVKGVDGVTTKYSYDALGRRTATTGGKVDTKYAYDEVGNLVSQTSTGAYDLALSYAYDKSGRMTQESRTEQGATLESSYVYDALGQLTAFTRSDGLSESYAYDAVGNMTAKTANGVKTAMTYNAANQLVRSVSAGETTRYSYDANGNLLKAENAGGTRSYAYNALGLLASFTGEDGYSESYTYNANRLLSGITSDAGTTSLTYDILYGEGVVIGETRNGQTTNYTYGLDRVSAITGSTRTEYIYDGRGSVAAEVSYNKAWYTFGGGLARKNVTSKSYTPFGEQLGEAATGFGYNGEYYNAATGMVYLRARFYEPELNRFSQKDLLRGEVMQPGSLNRYLYVQNDPVNFVDESGQSLKSAWNSFTGKVSNAYNKAVTYVNNKLSTLTTPKTTGTTQANSVATTVRAISSDVSAYGQAQRDRIQQQQQIQQYSASVNLWPTPSYTEWSVTRAKIETIFRNMFNCEKVGNAQRKENSKKANEQLTAPPASLLEAIGQAEMAKLESERLVSEQMTDVLLGGINSFGRNGIDVLTSIRKLFPHRPSRVDANARSSKDTLEEYTRGLANDPILYDVGQIVGDVGTMVVGIKALVKGAQLGAKVIGKVPDFLNWLSRMGGTLALADGPMIESAGIITGTASVADVIAEGWLLAKDVVFNYNAFEKDINTLQEDMDARNKYSSDGKYTGGRSEEELEALAKDPDHAGSKRLSDIEKGKREAEVALDLEEQGVLENVVRAPRGRGDFVEQGGAGQVWDVKQFNSNYSNGYEVNEAILDIEREVKKGENVIIDTINMKAEHISELMEAITKSGLDKNVRWWFPK